MRPVPPATGWLTCSEGGRVPPLSRARAHPPPQEGVPGWAAHQPRPGPKQATRPRQAVASDGELLEHLRTPAAFGGHEFGDWPLDQIASGFGGDLDARHRHDHNRLATEFSPTPRPRPRPDPRRRTHLRPAQSRLRRPRRPAQPLRAPSGPGPGGRPGARVRVAVHDSRQNDRNPVIGEPARTTAWPRPSTPPATSPPAWHGPERTGSER